MDTPIIIAPGIKPKNNILLYIIIGIIGLFLLFVIGGAILVSVIINSSLKVATNTSKTIDNFAKNIPNDDPNSYFGSSSNETPSTADDFKYEASDRFRLICTLNNNDNFDVDNYYYEPDSTIFITTKDKLKNCTGLVLGSIKLIDQKKDNINYTYTFYADVKYKDGTAKPIQFSYQYISDTSKSHNSSNVSQGYKITKILI